MKWKTRELSKIIDIFDNQRIPLSALERESKKGEYPYYGASGIIDYLDEFIFDGKYLLISEDGENLKTRKTPIIFFASGKFWVNNHAHIVKGKKDILDDSFLLYAMSNSNISGYITGAAQPKLSQANLCKIEIPFPPLQVQQKISRALSNYDDLIENNNKRIKILEEMAQKIYKQWFVDFKFPNHETATFKDSELGKIPSDWNIKIAQDISDIYIGRTPSRKDFDCFSTKQGIKWISIKDIGNANEFISETSEYLTKDSVHKYNVPLIPNNTVILSFKLTVGKVTITTENMCSNEAIAQFNIKNSSNIFTYYLYSYLKNFKYENLGNTSSIGNAVNSTIIKNMQIVVPQKEIGMEFNDLITPIFEQIKNLSSKNQTLKQTRDMLLHRIISGEIDVEKLEIL